MWYIVLLVILGILFLLAELLLLPGVSVGAFLAMACYGGAIWYAFDSLGVTAGIWTIAAVAVISLIACAVTGFCTAMLWPGTLIMMEENIPGAGVTAFAMMAAAGDSGAALAPQLLGVVVDTVAVSEYGISLAEKLSLSPEQVGMKAGMLVCSVFPVIGIFIVLYIMKYFKKKIF